MKTFISLLLILLTVNVMNAQCAQKNIVKKEHCINMRGIRISFHNESDPLKAFRIFQSGFFHPEVSVHFTDGPGIHLFTVSDIRPLPSFSIGAKFKAGFTITI